MPPLFSSKGLIESLMVFDKITRIELINHRMEVSRLSTCASVDSQGIQLLLWQGPESRVQQILYSPLVR